MDVNGTLHFLFAERELEVLAPATGEDGALVWRSDRGLVLPPLLFEPPPGLDVVVVKGPGAAVDRYGNLYFIEAGGRRIITRSASGGFEGAYFPPPQPAARGSASLFRPAEPAAEPAPLDLFGLAVTSDHYLVAGSRSPAGLLVFDLHGRGPAAFVPFPASFRPRDMAAAPNGGLWILDAASDGNRLWWVPRNFPQPESTTPAPQSPFVPLEGAEEPAQTDANVTRPTRIALSADSGEPVAVEALADGTALVLGNPTTGAGTPRLSTYDTSGRVAGPLDLDDAIRRGWGVTSPTSLRVSDFVLAEEERPGVASRRALLMLADERGHRAIGVELRIGAGWLSALAEATYYPLQGYRGVALLRSAGRPHYASGGRLAPIVAFPRPLQRRRGSLSLRWPAETGPAFIDSKLHDCVWHRLAFDGSVPPETKVRIFTRAANTLHELEQADWQEEPLPHARQGREQVFPARALPRTQTWETVLQRAKGRYLALRIELEGTGRQTPTVRALRVYYPRFSYLREYLPKVYAEDSVAASFLERFLCVPEAILTELEQRIAGADAFSDVRLVPREHLEWLARWVGVSLDPSWESWRQRLAVAVGPLLAHERGTERGILRALRLALDDCPDVSSVDIDAPKSRRRGQVRLLEHFAISRRSRAASAALQGSPSVWTRANGFSTLDDRYRGFLAERAARNPRLRSELGLEPAAPAELLVALTGVRFPLHQGALDAAYGSLPNEPAEVRLAWRRFRESRMDPPYLDVLERDLPSYRQLLIERYGSVAAIAARWGRSGSSRPAAVSDITFPASNALGAELDDWFDFVETVVPLLRGAHTFSVMVPVLPGDSDERIQRRLQRARAIVELEKPAHALLEVRAFWDLFRVGEARVELDAEIGAGARLLAAVLGETRLGESFAPGNAAWSEPGRGAVERDAPGDFRVS